jgi:fibronectin type 3 domain-containing protein/TolB-like protein
MLKKTVITSVVALMLLMAGALFAEESSLRPRLGCVPFMATSLQAMAFTEDISSSLLNSIDRNRYFEIVERKKIEQFLELEGLRLDNLDHDSILKISAKAGLDYVVHGSVNVTDAGTSLEINLLNVRARKVVMKESFSMSQTDFSRKLLEVAGVLVERVKAGMNQPQAMGPDLAAATVKSPHALEASGTSNSIRLRWQSDMKQIAGFNIYRSTSSGGQYSLHTTTSETSFTDENMKLNEAFYYRVAAVGQSGAISELTPPVRGGTAIAPPSPIFMNVEPDIKGARLVWRARPGIGGDSRTEAQGYRVYRKLRNDAEFTMVARLPVDAVSYADNGLGDGMEYLYTITAHNREGTESEYSSKLSVMALAVPNAIKASAGKIRHVPLTWDRYSGEQAEGYVLSRSDKKDGKYAVIAHLESLTATAYTDRELADNTTYWYRLSAYKKGGIETAPSEPVSVITRDIPPAPVNLTAVGAQPRMVTLKWQLAGTPQDEIKSVIIYRMMDEKGIALEKLAEVSASQNEFVDDKPALQDRTTYYYRLVARNSGGAMSQQTAVASATTKPPPAAPANLAGTSGEIKKTDLSWDRNRETDIKEYQVFVKRPTDADFRQIQGLFDNRYRDSDLKDGADYVYKIRVIDKDGLVSDFSGQVVVKTKPLPAKVTGFKAVDAASRKVAWNQNQEKDVRNYNVYKKGFLGAQQKLATVQSTQWQLDDTKGNVELYVTAIDESGLESEPSDMVVFRER